MKKSLALVLALLMVLPMLFSCQGETQKSTKYGNAETSIKVNVTIKNPDYKAPETTAPAESTAAASSTEEEEALDMENPEFFYDGVVELFVENPTVEDVLNASFLLIAKVFPDAQCSVNEKGELTICGTSDNLSGAVSYFWDCTINDTAIKSGVSVETVKNGDTLVFEYTSNAPATSSSAAAE